MLQDQVLREVNFKAVRSQGAGGQHVNKVATKVILVFNLTESQAFTEEEKERLSASLKNRLTLDGLLVIRVSETRSQFKNRRLAEKRLLALLEQHLQPAKERKKTKPTKASREKRLQKKRHISEKKAGRKKPDLD